VTGGNKKKKRKKVSTQSERKRKRRPKGGEGILKKTEDRGSCLPPIFTSQKEGYLEEKERRDELKRRGLEG